MAYAQAPTSETLFDANNAVQPDTEGLAFKDFGTGASAAAGVDGRLSPNLFAPDRDMQQKIGTAPGPMSLDYFSKYFDVDTKLVFERAWKTLWPFEDYVDIVLNNTPDLYGPFWLPTTLIFSLFVSNSLSASISAYLAGQPYAYDFTRLSVAVTIIYIYAFAVPVALWAVMRYWAGVDSRSPVDMVAIYGYGMFVWIPVALLCIPPVEIARFVFAVIAFVISGYFLARNIYPLLASAPSKAARILIVAVALVHTVLALALWFGFLGFSAPKVAPTPPSTTDPATATGDI